MDAVERVDGAIDYLENGRVLNIIFLFFRFYIVITFPHPLLFLSCNSPLQDLNPNTSLQWNKIGKRQNNNFWMQN